MQILDHILPLLIGSAVALSFSAYIHIRQECRHALELNKEWEAGRRHGYHQCYSEMVLPIMPRMRPTKANMPPVPAVPAVPERGLESALQPVAQEVGA